MAKSIAWHIPNKGSSKQNNQNTHRLRKASKLLTNTIFATAYGSWSYINAITARHGQIQQGSRRIKLARPTNSWGSIIGMTLNLHWPKAHITSWNNILQMAQRKSWTLSFSQASNQPMPHAILANQVYCGPVGALIEQACMAQGAAAEVTRAPNSHPTNSNCSRALVIQMHGEGITPPNDHIRHQQYASTAPS